jgi:NAD(P)-dependent dehydrogenase (short-subunit alcohol dehydrogenase family)
VNRVQGKVAIVTGGAMGIGEACAGLLTAEGATVVVTDANRAAGETAARRIGTQAVFIAQDVSFEADWQRVVADVLKRFGRLDILVNNAGLGIMGDVEHATTESWRMLLSVNLDGVFFGIRAAIPAMRRSGGGSIINLSSIEGLVGDPDLAAYNASKGGVRLLTKSAALYCARARTGIRVNSVHPGYIRTPMVENAVNASPDPAAMWRRLEGLHPVGHIGKPEDIAYGVLYLASDESAFVTGTELVIDGGYTAQ